MENNKESSNWVFNQCSVSGIWKGVHRDNYADMFNDFNSPNVIKSKQINTLIELIDKTDGDIFKMNKLAKAK